MNRRAEIKYYFLVLYLILIIFSSCKEKKYSPDNNNITSESSRDSTIQNKSADSITQNNNSDKAQDADIMLLISTFLGNNSRNYYGNTAPSKLDLIWKHWLGGGRSRMPNGDAILFGAGWTGQPLLISEKGKLYLFQGALDHNLKKIDAESGELIWEYEFDDVIKATGTLWYNANGKEEDNRLVVLQGTRQGYKYYMGSKYIWSYRGISGITGKELYRINVKRTESGSRDVDGSASVVNDTAYVGFENGIFTVFNPDVSLSENSGDYNEPEILQEIKLYDKSDLSRHGSNVITESSPCRIGNMLYMAAGSGHVYGYDIIKKEITWDFYIGSDLNGSCVATFDKCILVTVEKQYIQGRGGVLKLDPSKTEDEAVVWYFAVNNKSFFDWDGGVIGSPAVNDNYTQDGELHLAAFTGIDGYVYVVEHNVFEEGETEIGFDGRQKYAKPRLVYKYKTGASISSPIILRNRLVAAGYSGLYLFGYNAEAEFELIDKRQGGFEATPIAWDGRIYIGSKDGWLYCLGDE